MEVNHGQEETRHEETGQEEHGQEGNAPSSGQEGLIIHLQPGPRARHRSINFSDILF
jgi:hypothetical protein